MDTQKPDAINAAINGFDFSPFDTGMVYVKPIDAALVPGLSEIPAGTVVYAVHAADGRPLAVVNNRSAAFIAARQYNMEPVSVH